MRQLRCVAVGALLLMGQALPLLPEIVRPALGDELIFPSPALPPERPAQMIYRLSSPRSGSGIFATEWTDALGDVIARRSIRVTIHHQSEIHFTLDPRRSLATANTLTARLTLDGQVSGVVAPFFIAPRLPDWSDYQLVIWQPQTAAGYRAFGTIGVNAAMLLIDRDAPGRIVAETLDPLLNGGVRPYIENIATDFYSAYHRFFPTRPVNWRFLAAQSLYHDHPGDPSSFIRDPSLSDPTWLRKIDRRLRDAVKAYGPYRPLFYNLADEAGIADLSAYWDFDFSDDSVAGMREWLRARYRTLAALNRAWGADFPDWNSVQPTSTVAAMARADENYAAWSDFKEWMDVAFARAIAAGRDAVHSADPHAVVGLEGVQKPRWGGYDYDLLAHAVDAIEVDAEPQNLDLLRSLNPRLRLITTVSLGGAAAEHGVWRALLQGTSGLILWDSDHRLASPDGQLGQLGLTAGSYLREIRDGIGAVLINSRPVPSPVAILYSPESLRIQWMLDWRSQGDAWASRGSEDEWRDDGSVRGAMNGYRRALEQLGVEPRYVSPPMLEHGALEDGTTRVLILPHVIAMSDGEARALRRFTARGGTIIADVEPGSFDGHGRKRDRPLLSGLVRGGDATGHRIEQSPLALAPEQDDGDPSTHILAADLARLAGALREADVAPRIMLRTVDGGNPEDIAQREWRNGKITIVALQRDFRPGAPRVETVAARLPSWSYLYDLRRHAFLGRKHEISVALDNTAPAIFAAAPVPLPPPALSLPRHATQGQRVRLRVTLDGASLSSFRVLRLAVTSPGGTEVKPYSRTIISRSVTGDDEFWLPENAPVGQWRVSVTDVLSGQAATASIAVSKR
jgi:hypothetical protein